jgi:hypothetical protein
MFSVVWAASVVALCAIAGSSSIGEGSVAVPTSPPESTTKSNAGKKLFRDSTRALFDDDGTGAFLLTRSSATQHQLDIGIDDRQVSFARLFLDRRMTCEFAFVNERRWFGACAVYPLAGDTPIDIAMKNRVYGEQIRLNLYFLGSSQEPCRPLLVRKGAPYFDLREWQIPRLHNAIAQELAAWDQPSRGALQTAIQGFPRHLLTGRKLARALSVLLGHESRSPHFSEEEIRATFNVTRPGLEEIPAEIQMRLSGEQLRGLEDFFDDKVLAIP